MIMVPKTTALPLGYTPKINFKLKAFFHVKLVLFS